MTDPISQEAARAKHTPGPWHVDGRGIRALVRGADLTIVATRHMHRADKHMANARLIAAAPTLLEALQEMLGLYLRLANSGDAGNWDPEDEAPVIQSRAAIALATGGE